MTEFTGYSDWEGPNGLSSALSAQEQKSLRRYQAMPVLNFELRNKSVLTKDNLKDMSNLDKIIAKKMYPSDLVLFRASELSYRGNTPYALGEEFTDVAYTSTSISYDAADFIAGYKKATDKTRTTVIYVMYNPHDFKGLWIGNSRRLDYQQEELLLARDGKFKVMATKMKGDTVIQILQICEKTCDQSVSHPDVESIFSSI